MQIFIKKVIFLIILSMFTFNISPNNTSNKEEKIRQNDKTEIEIRNKAPKIFIDCDDCDLKYIKTNIEFVNYVVNTKEAEVYILITSQDTGSGGEKYTLEFTGQGKFTGINDKLFCITSQDDTSDKIREKLLQKLQIGLIGYIKPKFFIKIVAKCSRSPL